MKTTVTLLCAGLIGASFHAHSATAQPWVAPAIVGSVLVGAAIGAAATNSVYAAPYAYAYSGYGYGYGYGPYAYAPSAYSYPAYSYYGYGYPARAAYAYAGPYGYPPRYACYVERRYDRYGVYRVRVCR